MAGFKHGKDTYFRLDNNAGTLVDLSPYLNSVDFPRDRDNPETTVFGNDGNRSYIAGLRNASISIAGFFDGGASAIDKQLADLFEGSNADVSKTFEYGPGGNVSGEPLYSGEVFISTYAISSPVDGVVAFTADFLVTGAVTRATI